MLLVLRALFTYNGCAWVLGSSRNLEIRGLVSTSVVSHYYPIVLIVSVHPFVHCVTIICLASNIN